MSYKVIDVSDWQGIINWDQVKADGVEAAIIRYADGTTRDSKFAFNMSECNRVGIHVGAYLFSRATSVNGVIDEADRLIAACSKFYVDMPLYLDLEWNNQINIADTLAYAYLTHCKSKGVKGGIYANLNWFTNYITATKYYDYPLWIAQYYTSITHKNPQLFGMWQYSSTHSVSGISGNVDVDWGYVKYWEQIKSPQTGSQATPNSKITSPTVVETKKPAVTVDGFFYAQSVKTMQRWLGMHSVDGVISGQPRSCRKYLPAIAPACEFVWFSRGGSATIKTLQHKLNIVADGYMGKNTVMALQRYLNTHGACLAIDGTFGVSTARAFQKYLNSIM